MRPVDKGTNDNVFEKYSHARGDLLDRLGQYCSYCEMKLPSSLAVEHVRPKSLHPELQTQWDNFLLACTNCNSTKGDQPVNLEEYVWPDRDNTFLAMIYREGGIISANNELDSRRQRCAQNILDLTGLRKRPGSHDLKRSDRRWFNRREAWSMAARSLERLMQNDSEALREQIVDTAYSGGFWSVWMTVFEKDGDMLNRFIERFPGTCKSCFDGEGKVVPREGGIL